ncbi:hypothetical protein KEM54_002637 [Ascosphaera aggregata]|nr:hypothetical protein KEM54_002637 [Ascosphaera aggregata]
MYKESLTSSPLRRSFICELRDYGDPSKPLFNVLFCHPCHGQSADPLQPAFELLPLPVPSSEAFDYICYAVSADGTLSGLLLRQFDSPGAGDAAQESSLYGNLTKPYRRQYDDDEGTKGEKRSRLGLVKVKVSSICKTDGVRCVRVYWQPAPLKASSTSLSSSTTSRLRRNHDKNDILQTHGEGGVQQGRESLISGTGPSATEKLISISPPPSPLISHSFSIHLDSSSTKPEAADSPGTFTPNFITDPQTRKIFRSLAIVALIICLKWLLFKYIQRTTAYRRRRADLLSRTEERRRGWRIVDADDLRDSHSGIIRPPVPNGSTRPPLMEDEIINFRRVLEYVGELVRGDSFYESYSFSSNPSDDIELGYYDSDISMSEYNNNSSRGSGGGGGRDGSGNTSRSNQRGGFVNIAWRYGYAPRRFATPPPSSIAQLTTFSSPPTSDTETEGREGGDNDVDGDASNDGTFVTCIEDEDEVDGETDGRTTDENNLGNTSVSDEGQEETDMLIARVNQLGVK